jgi:hypothetical protein
MVKRGHGDQAVLDGHRRAGLPKACEQLGPPRTGLRVPRQAVPCVAHADETDNFTCRNRPLRDALDALDA